MNRKYGDRQDLKWLCQSIRETGLWVLVLTVIRMVQGVIDVGYAVLLRQVIDQAVDGDSDRVARTILLFLGMVIFQVLLQCLSRFLGEYIAASAENKLKQRLFRNLLCKKYAQVTAVHSGEWMNRLTSDTKIVADSLVQILPGAVGMISRMLGAIFMLLVMVPRLAVVLLIGACAVVPATLWMRKWLKRMHRDIQESDGKLRISLTEWLNSLLIIKSYSQESSIAELAEEKMGQHLVSRMRKNHFSNFCNAVFILAVHVGYVLSAGYCAFGILSHTLSYGTFTAVIQLIGKLQTPLAGLSGFVPQYYAMLASSERLMDAEDFMEDSASSGQQNPENFEAIGVRNLSFSYTTGDPHAPAVLTDLSFQIRKGEYAAFTGPSGCGKSTVLKLLMDLYQPQSGDCYLKTCCGETSLTESSRNLFAYVPQGNQLMTGTIREVITFSAPEYMCNRTAIDNALDIACAKEFVDQLPNGLDTRLGERGSGLSEGQMQRLAVARALLSDRPILLLDESTSALDEESEAQLLKNLRAMTGKTVVIITHRPAALQIVDKVISFPAHSSAPEDGTC